MRVRTFAALAALLPALVPGTAACGAGGGIEGTYADDMGVVSYTFGDDGKVTVTGPFGSEVEMDYEVDGDRVLVGGSEGRQVLTITEEGHLDMGMTVLKKQEE